MLYRGFEMGRYEGVTRTGAPLHGVAIRQNDKLLTVAADKDMARRHIDDRVKRGVWKAAGPEQMRMEI